MRGRGKRGYCQPRCKPNNNLLRRKERGLGENETFKERDKKFNRRDQKE